MNNPSADAAIDPKQARTPGSAAVEACTEELRSIGESHPDWYAWFEHLDPDICGQGELLQLLETAPTPLARGFLFGKLALRQQIALITGRQML